MSTYRLSDIDRKELRLAIDRDEAAGRYDRNLFAAVEAIIAPIHARAEAAEAEVARWQEKAQEAGAAYGLANAKHHEELDRANRLERLADRLAEKAVDLEDRAWAAEKRANDLAAVIVDVRVLVDEAQGLGSNNVSAHNLAALLPDDTKEADRG